MAEGRIGKALVALAIQLHAVELDHHVIDAVARGVPDPAGLLVDLQNFDDIELVAGKAGKLFALEIVEIEVLVIAPLRHPDEAPAVIEEARARSSCPALRPCLPNNGMAGAGFRRT